MLSYRIAVTLPATAELLASGLDEDAAARVRFGRAFRQLDDEAVERIRRGFLQCAEGWEIGKGATFHVVLTVERPKP